MKTRKGFVSNSSSSSFVCDSCGGEQSGWDLCLSEAEMAECVNGHVICESHMLPVASLTEAQMKKILDDNQVLIEEDETVVDTYESWYDDSDWRYSMPEEQCSICQMNDVTDDVLLTYLLKKCNSDKKTLTAEVQSKFNTLSELDSWDGK